MAARSHLFAVKQLYSARRTSKCSTSHLFLSLLIQWCSPLVPNASLSPKLNIVHVSRSLSPALRPWQEGQQQTPAACLRHSVGDQQAIFDQLCASSRTASKCWTVTSQTALSVNTVKLTQNKVLYSFTPEMIRDEESNSRSHYQATCFSVAILLIHRRWVVLLNDKWYHYFRNSWEVRENVHS